MKNKISFLLQVCDNLAMSLITKIIIDTAEYDRLINIEHEYKRLKEGQSYNTKEKVSNKEEQGGRGHTQCSCTASTAEKCTCGKTPPLSEIIALNEQARSVNTPQRGILPSITDPNDISLRSIKKSSKSSNAIKKKSSVKKKRKKGGAKSGTSPKLTEYGTSPKHGENLDHDEWKVFAHDKSNWYYLGHYEEK